MDGQSNYVGEGDPYNEVTIHIRYGHPSGSFQAVHPGSGTKQLGETPAEAVREVWSLLQAARQLPTIFVATCACGDYATYDSERSAIEWGGAHEAECEDRDGEEVHVFVVEP